MKMIIKRILFILFLWAPALNVIFAVFIALVPYWVITGNIYFEAKYFKFIQNWHWGLKSYKPKTK